MLAEARGAFVFASSAHFPRSWREIQGLHLPYPHVSYAPYSPNAERAALRPGLSRRGPRGRIAAAERPRRPAGAEARRFALALRASGGGGDRDSPSPARRPDHLASPPAIQLHPDPDVARPRGRDLDRGALASTRAARRHRHGRSARPLLDRRGHLHHRPAPRRRTSAGRRSASAVEVPDGASRVSLLTMDHEIGPSERPLRPAPHRADHDRRRRLARLRGDDPRGRDGREGGRRLRRRGRHPRCPSGHARRRRAGQAHPKPRGGRPAQRAGATAASSYYDAHPDAQRPRH